MPAFCSDASLHSYAHGSMQGFLGGAIFLMINFIEEEEEEQEEEEEEDEEGVASTRKSGD